MPLSGNRRETRPGKEPGAANGTACEPVEETAASQARIFRSVIHNLADGVVAVDRNGRFLVVNPAAERIVGMTATDAPPSDWAETYGCFHPDRTTPFRTDDLPIVRAMKGEETSEVEIFIRNTEIPEGVMLSVNGAPLQDEEGRVCGGVIVFRDMTPRRRAEETIERLSNAVEQTADGVLITDRSGRIEYVNPAFEKTTGYTAEEVLGQTPRLLKSGEHDADMYRKLWSTICEGEAFRGILVNRKKNDELYYAEQTITPMKDAGGNVTHFVSVMKDITERKKREDQETEMRIARFVQQRLYPVHAPALDGFDIAGTTYPSGYLCGDCFDYIPMRDDNLGIVIGDVSGHGLGPALLMAEVRAYLRAFAQTHRDVGEILCRVNECLHTDLEDVHFVTMILARLDPRRRSLVYANAGHPSGYILSGTGALKGTLKSTGTALGLFSDATFPAAPAVLLEPGDIVALVTDGITECESPEESFFDAERLLTTLRAHRHEPAREIVARLHEAACGFAETDSHSDDITLMICKVDPE